MSGPAPPFSPVFLFDLVPQVPEQIHCFNALSSSLCFLYSEGDTLTIFSPLIFVLPIFFFFHLLLMGPLSSLLHLSDTTRSQRSCKMPGPYSVNSNQTHDVMLQEVRLSPWLGNCLAWSGCVIVSHVITVSFGCTWISIVPKEKILSHMSGVENGWKLMFGLVNKVVAYPGCSLPLPNDSWVRLSWDRLPASKE